MKPTCVCTDCGHEQGSMIACESCTSCRVVLIEVLEEHFGARWRDLIKDKIEQRKQEAAQMAKAKQKKSSSRRKKTYVGKKVHALPLNYGPMNWLKNNAGKGVEWTVVKLVKHEGEYLTLQAANGKVREFGPHEMTWMAITSVHEENERLIKLTAGVIADWIEPRDPLLATAIREGQWRGNPPKSAKYLTVGATPIEPKFKET